MIIKFIVVFQMNLTGQHIVDLRYVLSCSLLAICLILKVPRVTKTYFLLMTSADHQG